MIDTYGTDNNIMIDIETLGTGSNAVMISLAAIRFNPRTGETFETFEGFLNIDDSVKLGKKVTEGTIMWWFSQEDKAIKTLMKKYKNNVDSVENILNKFHEWLIKVSPKNKKGDPDFYIWGNGPGLDLGIVKNYYHKSGMSEPWFFGKETCVRSIVRFNPKLKYNQKFEGVAHDGIDDCKHQIKYVSNILKTIQVNE